MNNRVFLDCGCCVKDGVRHLCPTCADGGPRQAGAGQNAVLQARVALLEEALKKASSWFDAYDEVGVFMHSDVDDILDAALSTTDADLTAQLRQIVGALDGAGVYVSWTVNDGVAGSVKAAAKVSEALATPLAQAILKSQSRE